MQKYSQIFEENIMVKLCGMVTENKYEDLPSHISEFAKELILNVLGTTIGGSSQEPIPEIVDFVKKQGGSPESFIPFYGGKVPASMAAFAIGPMARALDMGDVHEMALHTSEYVFPPLLAATGLRAKVTGKEFINAFVVGEEILVRIGEAARALDHASLGIDHGGHFIFGAVAAVSKLLGLSLGELGNAMGMAVCMTQPHDMTMYSENSHMVRVHHAFVGQDAINICILAKKGIKASHNILLGKGYLRMHDRIGTDPDKLTQDLGEEWRMKGTMMKPYPSCKCTHTSIDGVLELMKEQRFSAKDIEAIHIEASSISIASTVEPKEDKWNPNTTPECQFSLPYNVASAAIDGTLFLDAYTEEAKRRKSVRDLMAKITVEEDKKLPHFASRVNVKLKDGRKLTKEIILVKGHPKNRFSVEELIAMFKLMIPYSAYKLSDSVVNSLIGIVLELEDTSDVVENLILPITPHC